MRVLVTGGAGFIGSHVVDSLIAADHHPVVMTRHSEWDMVKATSGHPGIPWIFGDVRDGHLVEKAVSNSDGVIHLAGVLGTQETIARPKLAAETNILGGLNVIEACSAHRVPLVNIGVGNYWMNNTYSITKHSVERLVDMTRHELGANMVTVRGLNAYGPRQVMPKPFGPSPVRKIMPTFIAQALAGSNLEVYGDGGQIMDMVYVLDLAQILVGTLEQIVDRPGSVPHTIEAGTGRPTTVKEIAETVIYACDTPSEIDFLPMRPGEPAHSVVLADTDALKQIGWTPDLLTSLEMGVAETVRWYKDRA